MKILSQRLAALALLLPFTTGCSEQVLEWRAGYYDFEVTHDDSLRRIDLMLVRGAIPERGDVHESRHLVPRRILPLLPEGKASESSTPSLPDPLFAIPLSDLPDSERVTLVVGGQARTKSGGDKGVRFRLEIQDDTGDLVALDTPHAVSLEAKGDAEGLASGSMQFIGARKLIPFPWLEVLLIAGGFLAGVGAMCAVFRKKA